jgi:hypothetical protein
LECYVFGPFVGGDYIIGALTGPSSMLRCMPHLICISVSSAKKRFAWFSQRTGRAQVDMPARTFACQARISAALWAA